MICEGFVRDLWGFYSKNRKHTFRLTHPGRIALKKFPAELKAHRLLTEIFPEFACNRFRLTFAELKSSSLTMKTLMQKMGLVGTTWDKPPAKDWSKTVYEYTNAEMNLHFPGNVSVLGFKKTFTN